MRNQEVILKIIIPIMALYLIFGTIFFLTQKSFIYFPPNQEFNQCTGFLDYKKADYNDTRFYLRERSGEEVFVYYHGNADSTCTASYLRPIFERSNSTLIFVEYSGYSNDDTKPSRNKILQDVRNIDNYIRNKSYTKVTVYGQSLGSGAASYHASLGNVQNLILVTPFSKLSDVVQSKMIIYPASILLTEEYDNIKWLSDYKEKITIIHGDNDRVISNRISQKLSDSLISKEKEYVLIEGGKHNNLWSSVEFRNSLLKALI